MLFVIVRTGCLPVTQMPMETDLKNVTDGKFFADFAATSMMSQCSDKPMQAGGCVGAGETIFQGHDLGTGEHL